MDDNNMEDLMLVMHTLYAKFLYNKKNVCGILYGIKFSSYFNKFS